MPAVRSEYDLIIAVHALDDAYKELIRTINQVEKRVAGSWSSTAFLI